MEAAPLIKAYDHAKAASDATQTSNTTVAVNEHAKAAGEFANAATSTTSVEALRTLKLLEQHHQRLSELLREPLERPRAPSGDGTISQTPDEKRSVSQNANPDELDPKTDGDGDVAGEKSPQPLPTFPRQQRYPSRDLGASIASNLASARGIRSKYRSQPLVPSVSNAEAPGNVESTPRKHTSGSKSKMQDMLEHNERPASRDSPPRISRQGSSEQRASDGPRRNPTSSSDDGFSKFYSAFGSIINRISAPLAFAGLPLVSEDTFEEPEPAPEPAVLKKTRPKASASVSTEPDLRGIYSKATLNAISRDGHSATDSFYVVPPSGHTASYASILSFADKEKRRMEASIHSDLGRVVEEPNEDDFVDAKETQAPGSPGLKRHSGKTRSDRELNNVVEELYTENKSLKDMLDKLSKRLHAFESMSQNSGMRLAESMRLMRPDSPHASGSKTVGDEALRKKNQELEDQLLLYGKQIEKLQKDNNKAQANLMRYREKWEQLKAGAKARRAGGLQGSSEATEEGSKSPSLA